MYKGTPSTVKGNGEYSSKYIQEPRVQILPLFLGKSRLNPRRRRVLLTVTFIGTGSIVECIGGVVLWSLVS